MSSVGFARDTFDRTLDATTHSARTFGNQTRWLFDDAGSFSERERLIAGATQTVHVETYILANDKTGRTLTQLLCAKAQQGVKVRLLFDGFGSDAALSLLARMRAAGVEVRIYHPTYEVWREFHRLHAKQLIVDGKVAIVGGRNYADEYCSGSPLRDGSAPWRDTDSETAGPAVHAAQSAFLRDWQIAGGTLTASQRAQALPAIALARGGTAIRMVTHRPYEDGDTNAERLYLAAIRASRHHIDIVSAYFLPSAAIRAALVERAQHGVKVRILTNSVTSSDVRTVALAARYMYPELLRGGVQIYEMRTRTLHAKTASFDGDTAIVGSANLDAQSLDQNIEIDEVVEDGVFAREHAAQFEKDLGSATRVTTRTLAEYPWYARFASWFAHLFDFVL